MGRPKTVIDATLAEKAEAALKALPDSKVCLRLKAIISSARYAISLVSSVFGTDRTTLWRWSKRFASKGIAGLTDEPKGHKPLKLGAEPRQQVASWLDELDANGCLGVGFGGGEPTLYQHFVGLCHYAAQKTGLAVTFTTHGHHLDDGLLSALSGSVHFVRISMDGIGDTYLIEAECFFVDDSKAVIIIGKYRPQGINMTSNISFKTCS